MTSFNRFGDRNRDQQDGIERHVYGEQEYVDGAGAVIRVEGTGTQDDEAVVLNGMTSFNLPVNFNTEVMLHASGSDTNQKYATLTIPRDKQRRWAVGTGGTQHPTDGTRAMEFNDKRLYFDDANVATRDGIFEVKDGKLYIRCDVFCSGDIGTAKNFRSPNPPLTPPTAGGVDVDVPGFDK